jgi:hypothetical protein
MSLAHRIGLGLLTLSALSSVQAQEKFTYMRDLQN